MRENFVSVVMTCHNEALFIEEAIRSVLAQTAYDRIGEIFVVNDGSTDGSASILDRLSHEIPKLSVIRSTGIGPSAARNLALERVKGTHVAFLDGDDLWAPDKTERQLKAFDASPMIALVYSDFYDFTMPDARDRKLISVRPFHFDDADVLTTYFLHDAPAMPSATIIAVKALDEVGFFDPSIRLGEDTELFLRIARCGRFQHVRGGLLFKRRHNANSSRDLSRWDEAAERVSDIAIKAMPELADFRSRRTASRRVKIASAYLSAGDREQAWRYLIRAIKGNPFNARAYVLVGLACLPFSLRGRIIGWLRSLRAHLRANVVLVRNR